MKMKNNFLLSSILILGIAVLIMIGCDKSESPATSTDTTDTGSDWNVLGTLGANNSVYSLCSDASGNIYAAGGFTNNSGYYYVAKWNGSSWTDIGLDANNIIREICSDAGGNVYAIGDFTDASNNYYIAKWNGSSWSKIYNTLYQYAETQEFNAICTDASGNVYASNGDLNTSNHFYVTKWNISWVLHLSKQ
jgi:hypothetical protein